MLGDARLYRTPMVPRVIYSQDDHHSDAAKLHTYRKRLIARKLGTVCTLQMLLVQTLLMPSPPSHNFSTIPALLTDRPSSAFFVTWLAPGTLCSPMVGSGMISQGTPTQMSPRRGITVRSPIMLFILTEATWPDDASGKLSCYLRLSPNKSR